MGVKNRGHLAAHATTGGQGDYLDNPGKQHIGKVNEEPAN